MDKLKKTDNIISLNTYNFHQGIIFFCDIIIICLSYIFVDFVGQLNHEFSNVNIYLSLR